MLKSARALLALAMLAALIAGCVSDVDSSPTLGVEPSPTLPNPTQTARLSPTATPTAAGTPTSTSSQTITPIRLGDTLAEAEYLLPLRVQHVTEKGAILLFELNAPSEGVLLYWPVDAPQSQSSLNLLPDEPRQQITLEGLEPGVTYQAELGLLDSAGMYRQPGFMGQVWGPIRFRTVPAGEMLRVGVVGDSGFGQQATFSLAEQMAGANLDLTLHTGDVVYRIVDNADPLEAYTLKFYAPFAPVLRQMPFYPVLGNHDVEPSTLWNGTPFYHHAFPPFPNPDFAPSDQAELNRWYAFAYDQIQFIMLDTQAFYGETGWAEQNAWLQERLQDPLFAYSIPVFHVPPYTSGRYRDAGQSIAQAWSPLFESAGVPLVLSGHDHNYQRLVVNDVTYVISGGGSVYLYDSQGAIPESRAFAKRTHFVLLGFYPDRIELQAIALGGEVLDQATIPLQ